VAHFGSTRDLDIRPQNRYKRTACEIHLRYRTRKPHSRTPTHILSLYYKATPHTSYAEVSFQWHPEAARATNTQQIWRQEFLGSRSLTVERSSTRTAAAGNFLRFLQTIFENTSLWRLKRIVSLSTYRSYINKCIYLSIYLAQWMWCWPFDLEWPCLSTFQNVQVLRIALSLFWQF